jgi:hypothetical protein
LNHETLLSLCCFELAGFGKSAEAFEENEEKNGSLPLQSSSSTFGLGARFYSNPLPPIAYKFGVVWFILPLNFDLNRTKLI